MLDGGGGFTRGLHHHAALLQGDGVAVGVGGVDGDFPWLDFDGFGGGVVASGGVSGGAVAQACVHHAEAADEQQDAEDDGGLMQKEVGPAAGAGHGLARVRPSHRAEASGFLLQEHHDDKQKSEGGEDVERPHECQGNKGK